MAFLVRSHRPGFTVTYACPEARGALREVRRAQRLAYPDVSVVDGAGRPVPEAELLRMTARDILHAAEVTCGIDR